MSTLRELIVSIDFNDIDTKKLLQIDSAMDEIEDSLGDISHELTSTSAHFHAMGKQGSDALGEIREDAVTAAVAVDNLDHQVSQLDRSVYKVSFSTMFLSLKIKLLVAAASALIPVTAAVGAGAMGLVSSFAAAGIAATGFGIVAGGVLTDLFKTQKDIQKLEEKVANAKTTKQRIEAEKELANALSGVSAAQRGALEDLKEFKGFWKGFTKQFQVPVFKVFGKGLDLIQNILTALAPSAQIAGKVINDMLFKMNMAFESNQFKWFFDWLNSTAGPSLTATMETIGNVFEGILGLFTAFSPIQSDMETGLVNLTQRFADWSKGLSDSDGFQKFIEYAKENGPVVLGVIGDLWDIFKNLVKDLAPFGAEVLQGIQDFTSLIADNWEETKDITIALAAGIGTLVLGLKGLEIAGIIGGLMRAYAAGTLVAELATLGFNAALWANPITWVIAGIAALVVAGVLLYRNWDVVKEKMSKVWDAIKSAGATAIDFVTGKINGMIDLINKIPGIDIPKIPKIGKDKPDGSHATGLASVPYDNYLANVHKGEAILTARQSTALRGAGILGGQNKPVVNVGGKGGNMTFAPNVTVYANGGTDASALKQMISKQLEEQWIKMQMALEG